MIRQLELMKTVITPKFTEIGCSVVENAKKDDNEEVLAYKNDESYEGYAIRYNTDKKVFMLQLCDVNEDDTIELTKNVTQWLFDSAVDTQKELEGIARDFIESIVGPDNHATVKAIVGQPKKKKKGADEDRVVNALFFMNRMVGFFPELKEEMNKEKITYGKLRYSFLTKSFLVPNCEKFVKETKDIKKMTDLFNDMYDNGDADVRAIIVHGLFNSLSDEAMAKIQEGFSADLEKLYKCSRPLKDRKIKPEKVKKESKPGFMSKVRENALLEQQRRNS